MIIGFGRTEKETATRILEECAEAFKLKGIDGLRAIQAKYAEESKRYKEMAIDEVPERYSYFWANHYPIYEGKCFIEFTIHHINRRHAFSPDGWALLETRWMLSVDQHDGAVIYSES